MRKHLLAACLGLMASLAAVSPALAGMIVADDFDRNQVSNDANPYGPINANGGDDGTLGFWNTPWIATGTVTFNGTNAAGASTPNTVEAVANSDLSRTFGDLAGANTTRWVRFDLQAEQVGSVSDNTFARVHFFNNSTTFGFGLEGAEMRLQMGGNSLLTSGAGLDDGLFHTFIGQLEFDVVSGNQERATVWLDPTGVDVNGIPVGFTAMLQLAGDLGQTSLGTRVDFFNFGDSATRIASLDDLVISTLASDVLSVPEPSTLGLVVVASVGWLMVPRRRRR